MTEKINMTMVSSIRSGSMELDSIGLEYGYDLCYHNGSTYFYGQNLRNNQERLGHGRPLFEPHPCDPVQSLRQDPPLAEPPEKAHLRAGAQEDGGFDHFYPRSVHYPEEW